MLKDILYRTVARDREAANRAEREARDRRLWGKISQQFPAAPAPAKGQGKKDKGKSRSKSQNPKEKGSGKGAGKGRSHSAKGQRKGANGKSGDGDRLLCANYIALGSCARGGDCRYRHDRPKNE